MRMMLLLFLVTCCQPLIALTVVYDNGKAQPVYRYLPAKSIKPLQKPVMRASLLPLQTPCENDFTVGAVNAHRAVLRHLGSRALFLIGDNPVSRKWLAANTERLRRIHALGLVVALRGDDSLAALQATTPLPLIVTNLQGLSSVIGTSHYPVVITKGWVVQ